MHDPEPHIPVNLPIHEKESSVIRDRMHSKSAQDLKKIYLHGKRFGRHSPATPICPFRSTQLFCFPPWGLFYVFLEQRECGVDFFDLCAVVLCIFKKPAHSEGSLSALWLSRGSVGGVSGAKWRIIFGRIRSPRYGLRSRPVAPVLCARLRPGSPNCLQMRYSKGVPLAVYP